MTDPLHTEPVEVTQADRDAVQAFHRAMAEKLMADITSGKAPTFGDDAGHDGDTIHQAFARHRTAAEAVSRAREARLREALDAAADRIERAAYIMSDERLTVLSEVFFRYADEARAALTASEGGEA